MCSRHSRVMTLPARFIPPMLCDRLADPAHLADRRYTAEPKLDGQHAQLHVQGGRAVACYSRRGLDLLQHAGMAWLTGLAWPFDDAVLDGEACAGDGHEGIHAVFTDRKRADGDIAFVAFDLLHLGGHTSWASPGAIAAA